MNLHRHCHFADQHARERAVHWEIASHRSWAHRRTAVATWVTAAANNPNKKCAFTPNVENCIWQRSLVSICNNRANRELPSLQSFSWCWMKELTCIDWLDLYICTNLPNFSVLEKKKAFFLGWQFKLNQCPFWLVVISDAIYYNQLSILPNDCCQHCQVRNFCLFQILFRRQISSEHFYWEPGIECNKMSTQKAHCRTLVRTIRSEHINYKGAITQTVARLQSLRPQSTPPVFFLIYITMLLLLSILQTSNIVASVIMKWINCLLQGSLSLFAARINWIPLLFAKSSVSSSSSCLFATCM